jgi:hypothetical protein
MAAVTPGVRVEVSSQGGSEREVILRSVTVLAGIVVALTFLFGFGNVFNLALRLGVPVWIAPLVAPAVDLSIVGLLLGTRHLALTGAPAEVLRPARRLLIFASVVTLALNVADPLVAAEYGRAAFDSVGPLLLIGWAEVGPGLLQAISTTGSLTMSNDADRSIAQVPAEADDEGGHERRVAEQGRRPGRRTPGSDPCDVLLERAKHEDMTHRARTQKPISADALRVQLGVGSARARRLVEIVRAEFEARDSTDLGMGDEVSDTQRAAVS